MSCRLPALCLVYLLHRRHELGYDSDLCVALGLNQGLLNYGLQSLEKHWMSLLCNLLMSPLL